MAARGWTEHAMGSHIDSQTRWWRWNRDGHVAMIVCDQTPSGPHWFGLIDDGELVALTDPADFAMFAHPNGGTP
jgi:hypothetical protein